MRPAAFARPLACSFLIGLGTSVTLANDVDGPNDCQRVTADRGDAPEDFNAYPGVIGHFPTCLAPSAPGVRDVFCLPISTVPGPTGFVLHTNPAPTIGYWFGCGAAAPLGIDSEPDGKTSPGTPLSACSPNVPVDCIEPTPVGVFGQDECFGSDDAGLAVRPALATCTMGNITFRTSNCNGDREVYLNVLVDMNADGDWNDNFACSGTCAYEWAVKNVLIQLPPGCITLTSPGFLVGPRPGFGWMRMSISDNPAPDDYPWAGSATFPGGSMIRGETEDYVVEITETGACPNQYRDFGDAPEGLTAYPSGVLGRFPTCVAAGVPGTIDATPGCPPPIGTPPGPTGYVEHVKAATDAIGFWFGCTATGGPVFVDSEPNGKVNLTPPAGTPSFCDDSTPTDCVEGAFIPAMPFGQDECFGDGVDAGLVSTPAFSRCAARPVRLAMYNCSTQPIDVFVNILVDWNQDGDWNDVLRCSRLQLCADEWAVVNFPVTLVPGCTVWTSPAIQAGPKEGFGWMRATVTAVPVAPDFPWNGSGSEPGGVYRGGETEDYPVVIDPSTVDAGGEDELEGAWFESIAPNPVTQGHSANVQFGLGRESHVRLSAFDVRGRLVRQLLNEKRAKGVYTVDWDFKSDQNDEVAPGVYFLRLETERRTVISRVTRTR